MGYFSTGTEGMDYEWHYCRRCVHLPEDGECPVMLLHALWNYEQCSAANDQYDGKEPADKASEAKLIALSTLIPRKDGWNQQCAMFHPRTTEPTPQQVVMREVRQTILGEI